LPAFSVDEQRLCWIASFDGRLFPRAADGRGARTRDVPRKIGSMWPREGGGAVVSLRRDSLFTVHGLGVRGVPEARFAG
jgi:L-arabinonolactonase